MEAILAKLAVMVIQGTIKMSVNSFVSNVVEATMPPNQSKISRMSARMGGMIIGNMVGDIAWQHTAKKIVKIMEAAEEAKAASDEIIDAE